MTRWSPWRRFPDPARHGVLVAPIGLGCYELRRIDTNELLIVGSAKNVAFRMTSLLPADFGGAGYRKNARKRKYVAVNIRRIEYRTCACPNATHSRSVETECLKRSNYRFHT